MSLRDSGRLNRIGGLRVSNVVDLGQVEISPQALDHADIPQPPSDPAIEVVRNTLRRPEWGKGKYTIKDIPIAIGSKRGVDLPNLVPALTIISHPLAHRAGERLLLAAVAAGGEVSLSCSSPDFTRPGRSLGQPLGDPFASRKPIRFAPGAGGGIRMIVDAGGTPVVAGAPVAGSAEFTADDLMHGVALELAERVVLLLHQVDRWVEDTTVDSLGMIGASTAIRRVRTAIEILVDLAVSVLIQGESGTGKELVARALHAGGSRDRPFVAINCSAIPDTLIDSELFGHARGAYSGATIDKPGLFVEADAGALFLDEIDGLPLHVQARLLRVLQEGEVRPVGSAEVKKVDVRVIAATHVDLRAAVVAGRFREDLFHRLNVVELHVPPLRERREDIGLLFYHFAREALEALGEGHRLSPQDPYARPWLPAHVAAQLVRYAWPGNIRELRNVTWQLVIENRGLPQLRIDPRLADQLGVSARPIDSGPPRPPSDPATEVRRKPSDVSERELHDALRACAWDLKAAADRLRIPRSSIFDLIERSPNIRTAGDLGADEIVQCFQACAGDLDAMVAQLQVSRRALSRRLRELGLPRRTRLASGSEDSDSIDTSSSSSTPPPARSSNDDEQEDPERRTATAPFRSRDIQTRALPSAPPPSTSGNDDEQKDRP